MILTGSQPPHAVLSKIARHLSPASDYKEVAHSSPPRWDFHDSKWTASAVFSPQPPHKLVGVSIDHPDLSDEEVCTVETTVGLLCRLDTSSENCIFLNERSWNQPDGDGWDSGYETLHRLRQDTLRITVRNVYDPARAPHEHQSTARAELCPRGVVRWRIIAELHGNLMSSRRGRYDENDRQRFHQDERELLRLVRTILNA